MTAPFPKTAPRYQFVCPTVMHAESIVRGIGTRIERCIEHQAMLRYVVTCGDDDAANLLRLLLKGKGLDPQVRSRKDFRDGGGRHRRDAGDGPIVFGFIPVSHLSTARTVMGPRARPGTLVARAQVAEAPAQVAEVVIKKVQDDLG